MHVQDTEPEMTTDRARAVNRTLGTVAYVACVLATASAEYELAVACGFGAKLSWCLPAALDVYVLVTLRTRRQVPLAVGVLAAVVSVAHLVSSGLLEVSIPVVIGVSLVAPLLLWQVHDLLWGHGPKKEKKADSPADLQGAPDRLEELQSQVSGVTEPQQGMLLQAPPADLQPPVEPLQEEPEVEQIDQETLVEKLVANGEPLPGRKTVADQYGVSDWIARQALREAKERLQENNQTAAMVKEN